MLYKFSSLIEIGELKLTFLNELEIRSTWKEMTDTAIIRIPKKVLVKGRDLTQKPIADVVKTGQKVVIRIGYNNKLNTHFVGYVSRSPIPSIPVEVRCEDEMWVLKRTQVKQKVFANGHLKDLLSYIVPGYKFDVLDTKLGANYSCLNEAEGTAAEALKKVESTFGLKAFFRLVPDATHPDGATPVLVIGKIYSSNDLTTVKPVKYKLRENTKADSLKYRFAEDNPIQIKGICKVPDGKDLKYTYPPYLKDGSSSTRTYIGVSQSELEAHVKADFIKANVSRYEGDITGFAVPFVRHGMVANIIDNFYEKRNVEYFVDQVVTRVSKSQGVQLISTIGYVVNEETRKTFK
jgi:hypothetical protein